MGAPIRTPRTSWIDEGLRALAAGGPDAVRIEALARALGVSRGGFYGYFDGRPALLEEMLDAWERAVIDEVERRVESEGGDARTKLRRLFALAASSRDLLKIEMAIRDWARRDKTVAKRLRRIDNRRMEYVRTLFSGFCADEDEVAARCVLAMSLFIAAPLIAADYKPRSRTEALTLAAQRLLA
jgi:AcrR family transcriptional regulator